MVDVIKEFALIKDIGQISGEGIAVYSIASKKILYTNPVAERLLRGIIEPDSQTDTDSIIRHIALEDREYVVHQFSSLLLGKSSVEVEFCWNNASPNPITLCCTAYFTSERRMITVFVRNITKAKEHEQYLVEFGTKKNTLLDSVLHNLSGALSLTQHLLGEVGKSEDKPLPEKIRSLLNLLSGNNEHCIDIISGLLVDEHLMAPKVSIKSKRVNIVEKLSYIFEKLKVTHRHRSFAFSFSSEPIYALVDEFKVLQIVNNLVSNSIKFTPETGQVKIRVQETSLEVIIAVADTGIGIPDSLKPFIFERLSIAGRPGLNGERSSGVGLHVCKSLIAMLNGKIWFESEEGKGSTFYVSFPKLI